MVYSPVDLLRLVASLIALALVVLFVNFGSSALSGAESDLIHQAERLPDGFVRLIVRVVQVIALFAPLVGGCVILARRQFRRFAGTLGAATAGTIIGRWIMTDLLDLSVARFEITGALAEASFPTAAFLAGFSSIVAADSPWMSHRWRRAARVWLFVLLALRVLSGQTGLRELIVAVAVGWVVGSAVGAIVGAPDRRPSELSIASSLARLGVSVAWVKHIKSVSGRHEYQVMTNGAISLRVLVAARDGWQTMLPGRLYRAVRFRDPADGRPFAGLRELAEHEALVSLKAEAGGVPTPTLEAIGEVDEGGGYLLAFRDSDTTPFSEVAEPGDDALTGLWNLLVRLRWARIAHQGLDQNAVVVGPDGEMQVINFGVADLTGDERVLSGDIAELLAWTSLQFSPERTVDAAIAALGPGVVARSLSRLQPLALTRSTRATIDSGTLESIAELIRERTGTDQQALAPLERIKPRHVLMFVMGVLAINALAPQLAGFPEVWKELQNADLIWVLAVALASATSYIFAAFGLSGSLAEPLPAGPNVALQVAGSFVGIAAPAQLGGVALQGRFLQRRGIDPAVVVAAIGLNQIAAFATHVIILIGFVWWAGSDELSQISLPSWATIGIGAGAVAVLAAVFLALPFGRRVVRETLVPALRRSAQGIVEVAKRPVRLVGLLGGTAGVTLSYTAALVAAVKCFYGDVPFAPVAIVYLLGSFVQAVAPTPGGLGAAEVAYIGGLTAIGVPSEQAVAAVLVYRFFTFFAPVLPGWFAMLWLQRTEAI